MSRRADRRREQADLVRGGNEDQRAARATLEERPPQHLTLDPHAWESACAGWRGGYHERARSPEGLPITVNGSWRCRWCWQLFDPPRQRSR
jgi:hypothetical protein